MVSRRKVLLSAPALVAAPSIALADSRYPDRPLRIVLGNRAGGTDDSISRLVAAKLAAEFGQGVVVENRGGGSTTIAGAHVAASAPDGYTLLCLISSSIAQTALRDKLPYGLNSFTPVVGVGGFPLALAGSAMTPQKVTTFEELVSIAKGPNGVMFASGGVGTMAHLNTVRLLKAVGGKGVHVPYRNNPEGLQALAGGFTQLMMASVSEVAALRGDGKLRALAVTSEQRLTSLPDVPTMRELGFPAINPTLWHGYVAPVGTPADVVAKLAASVTKAVKDPEFRSRFKQFSFQEDLRTGAALSAYITSEAARWREVIVENNIKITD
ncbi:tripartite tricarboxylate transporter substrate binding protein [Variovorax sp. LjRoot178]